MVTEKGEIKLLAFGLTKKFKEVPTLTGTPFYMAPEVIRGSSYDWHSDIWSLGVLLYILLSGYMPFPAQTKKELIEKLNSGKFTFHHKEFDNVSTEAKDLITRML